MFQNRILESNQNGCSWIVIHPTVATDPIASSVPAIPMQTGTSREWR